MRAGQFSHIPESQSATAQSAQPQPTARAAKSVADIVGI